MLRLTPDALLNLTVADPTVADSDFDARVSKPKLSGGAAPEDVGLADVAAGHFGAGMAELGLDRALVAVVHRDRGCVTAA